MSVAPVTPAAFDREYWLTHCEGFRVEAAEGRLGFVELVEEADEPVLVVRAGALGRRHLRIPASEVEFIVPRAERIWLHSPPRILDSRAA